MMSQTSNQPRDALNQMLDPSFMMGTGKSFLQTPGAKYSFVLHKKAKEINREMVNDMLTQWYENQDNMDMFEGQPDPIEWISKDFKNYTLYTYEVTGWKTKEYQNDNNGVAVHFLRMVDYWKGLHVQHLTIVDSKGNPIVKHSLSEFLSQMELERLQYETKNQQRFSFTIHIDRYRKDLM